MLSKNSFTLFLASAAFAASSVSAGGIRGVVTEKNDFANHGHKHRILADSLEQWKSKCSIGILQSCAGDGNINGCANCLFAQSTLTSSGSSGFNSCVKNMCNGCTAEAQAFYDCGTAPAPDTSSSGVPANPGATNSDKVVTDNNVEEETTSDGCPLLHPGSGSSCEGLIPEPFLYHKCYYRDDICHCRTDSPFYSCTPRPLAATSPATATDPVGPESPANPANPANPVLVPETPVDVQCSDDIVSGTECSSPGQECCVGGTSTCTCGSDNMFVCQKSACDAEPVVEEPVVQNPVNPAPVTDVAPVINNPVGVPIPNGTDFSLSSTWCPSNIINCDPCAQFLPDGNFEDSCSAPSNIDYNGMNLTEIQCRCYTQGNPNPVWECRYIGGTLGTITVPVAPSCNKTQTEEPNVEAPTDPVSVPETPAEPVVEFQQPPPQTVEEEEPPREIITEIPLTKVCLKRLPTSGLTKCDIPPGQICCHNVQFGIATVCTCENQFFKCEDGVPSDCPDDQNLNVIKPALPSH